ncbi:MAG TPA: phosphoribosylglycinamide formyltransferase [Actinomycetota bacterium]|jgi:phosphoribosylglycinamide formyltransferase-1
MAGRIVVLISGSGSNMDALAQSCEAGEVPGRVVAVLADRECPGLALAQARGIPTKVVSMKDYPDRETWSDALRAEVVGFDPDLVVSAGFMRILSPVFVDAFEGKLINLHPALLPAFPGAHSVRDALEAGVTETGSTVHFVDREVDHGPTILQEPVPVEADDTEESLHTRIKAIEHRMLPQACRLILEGKVKLGDGGVDIQGA